MKSESSYGHLADVISVEEAEELYNLLDKMKDEYENILNNENLKEIKKVFKKLESEKENIIEVLNDKNLIDDMVSFYKELENNKKAIDNNLSTLTLIIRDISNKKDAA